MKNICKLSLTFNASKLLKEFQELLPSWEMHFNTQYYSGNWSGIPLRAPVATNHALSAGDGNITEFEDTDYLKNSEYFNQVIQTFKSSKQSVRLLRLTPGSEIKEHRDFGLGFFDGAVRLHIPILTNSKVDFFVEKKNIIMATGECWFANFNVPHSVANRGETDRVHLVIDLQVNDWVRNLFVKEGIIKPGEKESQKHTREEQLQIIASLKEMGSEAALKLAREMEQKMK